MALARPLVPVLLMLLVAAIPGCGGDDTEPAAGHGAEAVPTDDPVEILVTQAQDGGSTALRVGHVLRIELPANPLTGCAWEVATVDESVLRVPFEEYLPPLPDQAVAQGTSIWRFEARGAGSTTVVLRCVRYGDDVPTEERTFTFRVIVD